ncbi:MAG: glycosyltransferase family 39 protein [Anaerolineae bacterium]|nr:glycosyltransferase family 39 protein [Anaerolineae bacterium]
MLPLVIILIAWALRLKGIDEQSIWYDEGLSILYAQSSLGDLLRGVSQSDHPPLHPLLLHGWIKACGASVSSVRLLSAWWNVLAVAAICRLGKRLLSRASGEIAALLMAISPFAIWFSQETRGYTLALTLIVGAIDAALDFFGRAFGLQPQNDAPRWPAFIAYVLLAAAALYTHFYSGFVLLALNLALGLGWLMQRIRLGRRAAPHHTLALVRWLGAQTAALLLFAPWLPMVAAQLDVNATYWHGAVHWKEVVGQTLWAFSAGETLRGLWAQGAAWSMLGLAALGTLSLGWRRRDRSTAALLWLWMLTPTLILIAITFNRPKFSPRYLLNALPAFLLLVAAGMHWLLRLARQHHFGPVSWVTWTLLTIPALIVFGATARSLENHYLDDTLYRPDMRGVVEYVQEHETDNNLIVLVGGYTYPAFKYYYDGPSAILPLPDKLLPTTRDPVDPGDLALLNEAIAGRSELWLVLWQPQVSDPTGLITDALEQTYPRLGVARPFHEMALLRFDIRAGPKLAHAPQIEQQTVFGDQIRLLGYTLPVDRARPGETLYVYLYWQAIRPPDADNKAFVQLLDDRNRIAAQQDLIAGAAEYPTSHWPAGATVRNRFLLTVRPDATPGRYQLIAGLYNPGSGVRLPASGAGAGQDYVLLAEIEIVQ